MVRCLLVCIAAFHALVIYPISGGQLGVSHLLVMPVFGLVLHDVIVGVAAVVPGWFRRPLRRVGIGAVTLAMLAAGCLQLIRSREAYLKNTTLGLPGSRYLRLEPEEVARYRFLAANLNVPRAGVPDAARIEQPVLLVAETTAHGLELHDVDGAPFPTLSRKSDLAPSGDNYDLSAMSLGSVYDVVTVG